MPNPDPPSPPPTLEEWRSVLDAALAFRDASPWTWMSEEDMFGIQDPETGMTYYACVLGALDELRALVLYEGVEGLAGLWQMRLTPLPDSLSALLLQKCLMASFEDREALEKRDLDILKRLGLKVRGRQAWPLFRHYLPGYAPWAVTGAQARFLALALEQALLVARRFQADPRLLPPSTPEGDYLVRVRQGKDAWVDRRQAPEQYAPSFDNPGVVVDIERLRRLQTTLPKSTVVLEMDFSLSPNSIQENDERPYFPVIILSGDHDTGMILAADISRPDSVAQNFIEQFLTIVERLGMLPKQVQVSRDEAEAWLAPATTPLGVSVKQVTKLKELSVAQGALAGFLDLGLEGLEAEMAGLDLPDLGLIDGEDAPLPPRRLRRTAKVGAGKKRGSGAAPVYQMKITLRGSRPPIWRRLLVPSDIRLDVLHDVFQAAMGWTNSHMHAFVIHGEQYGVADAELEMEDERRFTLDQLVPAEGARFFYEYDFGNDWQHEIRVEKVLPPQPGAALPVCVKGKGACPPEDCGGVWGYRDLVDALKDPKHPEHEEMRDWVDPAFDPEQFSVEDVNARLQHFQISH